MCRGILLNTKKTKRTTHDYSCHIYHTLVVKPILYKTQQRQQPWHSKWDALNFAQDGEWSNNELVSCLSSNWHLSGIIEVLRFKFIYRTRTPFYMIFMNNTYTLAYDFVVNVNYCKYAYQIYQDNVWWEYTML